MTMLLHHRLRLARRGLWYVVVAVLVVMALIAGAVSQLLPLAERHPERVAAWLSERVGRPVAFDKVETQWTRLGPLLRLDGMRIGSGDRTIVIGDAEMLISQYAGLLPGRSFTELRLRGLDLTLERGADGRWNVRGLPGQEQAGGDPFDALEGLGELQVIGGKLAVIAPGLHIDVRLPRVDVRLRVDGNRVRAGARAWMRTDSTPVQAAFDFDRQRGDGSAYAAAKQVDLAVWSPLLHLAGVAAEGGRGRVEAWAQLRAHRVAMVTLESKVDGLALRGAALADGTVPRTRFEQLQARMRWRLARDGWRLDAPLLRIGAGRQAQSLDGLVVAGGARRALLARRIDAGPLLAVAALSDAMAPGLRHWIVSTRPQAIASNIEVTGARDGRLQARGRIDGLGFAAVGNAPGISGLGGDLLGDSEGFAFTFDPKAPFRFDWPRGFGVVHPASLAGSVSGWRDGAGWRIATAKLRIRGADVGVSARGGLWFQGDGTRPRIDIAADVEPSPVVASRGFWVHYLMSPATVHWLDSALLGGTLHDAHAVVSGDLDDWPFNDRNGLFRADARISNATLKFQPDWPAAEQVDADVSFVADGFTVSGKSVIAGVGIRHFDAGIPHFGKAELGVKAEGGGDAARLLGLLRQSPLHRQYGETLDNIAASGLAAVTFDLDLPLHAGGGTSQLGGTVALAGVKLSERRWKLAFDGVRGRAEYGHGGFAADRLAVMRAGQPGKLSLRAGDYTRDPKQAFEAELDAVMAAQDLLDRAPELDWLKPRVEGRSPWTIALAIPKSTNAAAPTRLQLRSNLVGTALTLPAPLDKPAGVALATTVETNLPFESGEIAVAFGERLALRARSRNGQTGVRVELGSRQVSESPPASGLVATGRTATLDAIDWAALTRGGGDSKGGGLALRRIDVTAARLRLLGADFADTRVRATPSAAGTALQLDGDALAGAVLLPQADNAAIAGRLQRMHWRVGKPGVVSPTAATSSGDDVDPARIPPLNLVVDDLRFGDAHLGAATLRTRPLANGMRIEQLQTRTEKQRIDVNGEWTGRGAAARTRLGMVIDSEDFGALLAGFGYGGQLTGGKGTARFDAAWPGSPSGFALGNLDGTLKLSARDGQLTEVEPGAGRVLGLLSLTQLPRRLTLDFRDFFSRGFAFNKLDGDVRLSAGTARSDSLVIDGPAAEIHIRGAADLRAQTFDQTIEVLPKSGNLLTAVGAIAGGPIGAAVGAVANAVLKKPLGQLGAKTYRVTGPWKEPKVEVIGREQSRISAAQRLPSSG
jgi:uncharacterized protein (TIGR02099 family)